jgi:hypothetical protein
MARGFRNSRRGRNDRMSGSDKTGIKPVDKRGGAGKGNTHCVSYMYNNNNNTGNWGKAEDELEGDKEGLNVSREGGEAKEAESEPYVALLIILPYHKITNLQLIELK